MKTEDRVKMGEIYAEGYIPDPELHFTGKMDKMEQGATMSARIDKRIEQMLTALLSHYEALREDFRDNLDDENKLKALKDFHNDLADFSNILYNKLPEDPDQLPEGLPATQFDQ